MSPNTIKKDGDKYKGYIRGFYIFEWEDAEKELKKTYWGFSRATRSPRLTICYNNGILGVGVRWATDEIIEIGDIITLKSMYQ